jgi:hypothetical protein
LESWGVPINRGQGPDILTFGCEIKSRERSATSAQTITDMQLPEILTTVYRDSPVCSKFQQQLRVYTQDGIVVRARIFDFSSTDIQDLVRDAYEHARQQLAQDPTLPRTAYKDHYGFFERTDPDRPKRYSFRLSVGDMDRLEDMSRSTFNRHFY